MTDDEIELKIRATSEGFRIDEKLTDIMQD
jgi:hypothetical protein